ncbi:MAG: cytochrome c maturation protein CcmE [Chloroflexia bacterium]
MKPAHIIGGLVILAAVVLGAVSFANSLTPYVSIAEARSTGRSVQVHGYLKEDLGYDASGEYRFVLMDDRGDEMLVSYKGTRPANFEQATGFVAIGRFDPEAGVFRARKLLVKCPSKYQEQSEEYQRQRATEAVP